jgi:ribosomal protein S6--L-glutamate ligase
MKLGILSRSKKIYSTRRLIEAAEKRGHDVKVVNVLKCYMNITANNPDIYYKTNLEKCKLDFDAVIPRIGAKVTFYGTAVLRQFEVSGVWPLNGSIAISRSRDKLRAHQLLARKNIAMPVTGYAHSANATEDLIKFVGGAPLIVKVLTGTQGRGVLLAETNKAAESLINAFLNLQADFLVQEFIREADGADIRCFVIGDKVFAAMKRQSAEGDFRSNLHIGGKAEPVKLRPEERAIAVKAAKSLGLNVAGVDIVRSSQGPLVLEVNSSPGLEGIEKITGKDIASAIIEYIEKFAIKSVKKNSRQKV